MHKKAPTYEHRLIPFDENCAVEPAKRTLHELPPQFAKIVEKVRYQVEYRKPGYLNVS